jgi:hypothetical protein
VSTTRIEIRRQVAIAGRVTLAPSGEAATRAVVAITSGPATYEEWLGWRAAQHGGSLEGVADRPDHVRTAPDGYFHFLDLPGGHYGLTATVPTGGTRYGTGSAEADVVVAGDGDVTLGQADIVIPTTALSGRVAVPGPDGAPVHMAALRLSGGGQTFSRVDGMYALTALEAGRYVLAVSASGRQPASLEVTLERGVETMADVILEPASP